MTQFDESKVRRDGDGKFASKGPAAEDGSVQLAGNDSDGAEFETCCRNCGTSVQRTPQGDWVDQSDGDGCEAGTHSGVATTTCNTNFIRTGDVVIDSAGSHTIVGKSGYEGSDHRVRVWMDDADPNDPDQGHSYAQSEQWTKIDPEAQSQMEQANSRQIDIGRKDPVRVTTVQPGDLAEGDIIIHNGEPALVKLNQGPLPNGSGTPSWSHQMSIQTVEGTTSVETTTEDRFEKVIPEGAVADMKSGDPSFVKAEVLDTPEAAADHRAWEVRDSDIEEATARYQHHMDTKMLQALGNEKSAQVHRRWGAQDIYENAKTIAALRRGPMCGNHRWGHVRNCATCTQGNGHPAPMPAEIDPEHWREKARASRQASADSWARSDTDGFTSQWASDTTARQYELQARICEDGGKARYPALFTTEGKLVPAKLVDGQYGQSWGVLSDANDPSSRFTEYVNPSKASTAAKRDAAMAKKGYREGFVWAPAKAELGGSGRGLAGAMTVHPYAKRTDGGFSPDAEFAGWDTED